MKTPLIYFGAGWCSSTGDNVCTWRKKPALGLIWVAIEKKKSIFRLLIRSHVEIVASIFTVDIFTGTPGSTTGILDRFNSNPPRPFGRDSLRIYTTTSHLPEIIISAVRRRLFIDLALQR